MTEVKWALLCGADYYLHGSARSDDGVMRQFSPLSGCVRDVEETYKLLLQLGVDRKKITKLTASHKQGLDKPVEEESFWPTVKNIKRHLDSIYREASRGDLVYFHFSGHGTSRRTSNDFADASEDGDNLNGMALVTPDALVGKPYLTGHHLGALLQKMVDRKGLRITVILDSCFSGGSFRDPPPDRLRSRYVEPLKELPCDHELDPSDRELDKARDIALKQVSWLQEPENCTVITACGGRETAGETYIDTSRAVMGVLTHLMLKHLETSVGQRLPPHRYVLDHVRHSIRKTMSSTTKQTPMIYGDGKLEFFGNFTYYERETIYVRSRKGDTIELEVGRAQGVAIGALYELFPSDFAFVPGSKRALVQAQVVDVQMFKSIAQLVPNGRIVDAEKVAEGWRALLRRWAFNTPVQVKFESSDASARAQLSHELRQTQGLLLSEEDGGFSIRTDKDRAHYEIYYKGERLRGLPRVSLNAKSAAQQLAYVVSHIARFQALRDLASLPSSQYFPARKFNLKVEPQEIADGEDVKVSIHSKISGPAWVSLFCFTASWGIVKVDPDPSTGQAANEIDEWSPVESILTMEIPKHRRPDHPRRSQKIEDVFVVFASSRNQPAVSWGDICLPPLSPTGQSIETHDLLRTYNSLSRDPKTSKNRPPGDPYWTVVEEPVRVYSKGHISTKL
ncbi:hypothetical protein M426DRAFT_8119 [Hypoxylon sp. CI-4A]|nr:hypothetical protein M426DRAFT_8119 [Hypoxylon sp. CI-4A]